jgi:peptide chain release factor subunit 1
MIHAEELQGDSMEVLLYKQRKVIEVLDSSYGAHTSLISLLVPPNTQMTRISKLLTQEVATAVNIKDRVNRQSVIDALKSIQARMKLVS